MDNPKVKVKTDTNYIFSLNFYGPNAFPIYSLKNILFTYSDQQLKKYFKNKLVFVGYTASAKGIYDMRPNPFSANAPGVIIHATAASNFLQGISMQRFPYRTIWVAGVLSLIFLINIFVNKPSVLAVFFVASLFVYVLIVQLSFDKGIWLEEFYPTLSMVIMFSFNISYLGIRELKEKNKTKSFFQRFVPEDVVKQILKEGVKLGGEKKTITVLFSDIVSFTTLSEKLKPEEVVSILNRHLTNCVEAIMENKGTLDKFIGDAILAFYGAPVEYGDEPLRAVKSALKMVEYGEKLAEELHKEGFPFDFSFGIGIHYGKAVIGNIGSPVRMDYTCIGDAVNTASRIEGLTRNLKRKILISEEVYDQVKDKVNCEDMGFHMVKGKEKPVHIYAVKGLK
jgi:adenylate cyclase